MEKILYDIIADMRTLMNSLKDQLEVLEDRLNRLEKAPEELVEGIGAETVAEKAVDGRGAEAGGDLPAEAEMAKPAEAELTAAGRAEDLPAEMAESHLPAEAEAAERTDDKPAAIPNATPEALPLQESVPMPDGPAEADPGIGDMPADEPIDISIDMDDFAGIGNISGTQAPAREKSLQDEFASPAAAKSINDLGKTRIKKSVSDAAREKQAWRRDMPGTAVKNIISAISLADRALLINTLFKGDPIAFNDAITAFNGMASFDEAEQYINEKHPGWNMNSDIVYRLMMAIRRKLR